MVFYEIADYRNGEKGDMYLKSLEVHGFKSFANKLVFEFNDGITAIVGPNGSGKSNVADAVRWVLGEQSAKQLRGARMEDVIFAGTQMRKPLGYAYVAITISNEDHKLNLPYEEITVARRVYRSGESEYLLNGSACRLKDVQELFFDTGIGKEGYSIIGQGQIDKILSGRPEERRELFDEAAGIVKYKKRKAATQKNLEEEKANMLRVEDILSELEKQVEPLNKEAAKAKEFLKFRDELKVYDVNMFLNQYDSSTEKIKEIEDNEEIAENDSERINSELLKSKSEYNVIEEKIQEYTASIEENREKYTDAEIKQKEYENNIKILDEQIKSVKQNEAHFNDRKKELDEKIESLCKARSEYNKEKEELIRKSEEVGKKSEDNSNQIHEVRRLISDDEKLISECDAKKLESINLNTDVIAQKQKFDTILEQNTLKKAEITNRILKNKSEADRLKEVAEDEKDVLDDMKEKLVAIDELNKNIMNNINQLKSETISIQKKHNDIQSKYHMQNSRLLSVKNITERYDGFGQSIKKVMECKKDYPGLYGVVADIIKSPAQYETAIETALGGQLQNIVTDNENTAKKMIEYLKKNKFGRATFLPLTNINNRNSNIPDAALKDSGVVGTADTLVEADSKYKDLVGYLLGRVLVVDNIDNAIMLGKKYHHSIRMVTLEGDLLNPGGSMSGGAYKNSSNLLGRRREIETLEKEVAELSSSFRNITIELEENGKKINEEQLKVSGNTRLKNDVGIKLNTAQINYERALKDLKANEDELNRINLDAAQIDSDRKEIKIKIEEFDEKLRSREDNEKEIEDKKAEYKNALKEHQDKLKELLDESSAINLEISKNEQSTEFANSNLTRIEEEIKENKNQLDELINTNQNSGSILEEKNEAIEETKHNIESLNEEIISLKEIIKKDSEANKQLTEKNKEFINQQEVLMKNQNELEKEKLRLSNQKEKLKSSMDAYIEYMWEQYVITYSQASDLRVEVELTDSQLKKNISDLKNQIKALGDVNVNSIENSKEINERYELLHTQHDDIVSAAESLSKIIEELDEKMRAQFTEQFAHITESFDMVFKELFGGGKGKLELVEDEDVLTAGISIIAQPPGKKLQNMMQLSGGEKALTAIALLFAIQRLKPSPFCLLDEIEAALDDSNVDRYASYLHKLTADTQFIVITHRRGTMNAADILYGITMQEKGVSTLVSVNLLEDEIK